MVQSLCCAINLVGRKAATCGMRQAIKAPQNLSLSSTVTKVPFKELFLPVLKAS